MLECFYGTCYENKFRNRGNNYTLRANNNYFKAKGPKSLKSSGVYWVFNVVGPLGGTTTATQNRNAAGFCVELSGFYATPI